MQHPRTSHPTATALMAPARDDALVVRSLGWSLLFAGLRTFGGLVLLATAVAPDLGAGIAVRAAIGVAAAAVLAIAFRTLLREVRVEADGVFVRNILRSRRPAQRERIASALRAARPESAR